MTSSLGSVKFLFMKIFPMQGPGTVFNPEKKTEAYHEAKYKVFLQMGKHQREYRYQYIIELTDK